MGSLYREEYCLGWSGVQNCLMELASMSYQFDWIRLENQNILRVLSEIGKKKLGMETFNPFKTPRLDGEPW